MDTLEQTTDTKECCPKFIPAKWDEKYINWQHKQFIRSTVPTFFHIPFPPMIGKRVTGLMDLAEKHHSLPEEKTEILLLFADPTAFKTEMYLSVTNEVPGADNVTLDGMYFTKVFDGKFNEIPKFIKQVDSLLNQRSKNSKQYYVHYAYCPQCAKKFNHNYMIIFAKIT